MKNAESLVRVHTHTHTHNTFSEREILAKLAKVSLAYNKLIEKEIETI